MKLALIITDFGGGHSRNIVGSRNCAGLRTFSGFLAQSCQRTLASSCRHCSIHQVNVAGKTVGLKLHGDILSGPTNKCALTNKGANWMPAFAGMTPQ